MFKRVGNQVKRREVKNNIPQKTWSVCPVGAGARAESLHSLLSTRNALSDKGESRAVTGNHSEPSLPSPADLVSLFRIHSYPQVE